jgi:hypothetical protein
MELPNRPNFLRLKLLPIWKKSRTLMELPIRLIPYTEQLDPIRANPRTDNVDPNNMKSNIESELPTRAMP